MSKKKKINIGNILSKHGAIFNYITDPYGFRVGVVVMMKGETRDNPRVGWALFRETPYRVYGNNIRTLEGIPVANDLIEDILLRTCRSFNKHNDLSSPEMIEIYRDATALRNLKIGHVEGVGFFNDVLTNKGKADLLSLAIRRANTNRDRYFAYVPDNTDDFDSRENQIGADWGYNEIPINDPDDPYVVYSPVLTQTIKKAVREAEYRAWRYFK